ncbi:late competence protein required for DNA uptake (superfamily II DNA/RNA helicase) [Paenibacillus sp. JGP012]|uniref:helicase-related protein n=1 Tax=Paenibacillus sp. JGP012 TaxID=2735914 RepID=UPI00161F31D4|nr:helicase-related protein [Paenibacillus sp. JGP012]MBB6021654.1 late competence protein required for DNA uptake (superfamily II DNA/RNA helicase) [Paenibacillus sp. JGP012]
MKVALYVCRTDEKWSMILSLDIQVDVVWWLEGVSGRQVHQWLVLSLQLPLSQAAWLVEQFVPVRGMTGWDVEAWQSYLNAKLLEYERDSGEIEARGAVAVAMGASGWGGKGSEAGGWRSSKREDGGGGTGARGRGAAAQAVIVGGMPRAYPAEHWAQLLQCAALLAERMSGRQLLAAEAEALLAAEPAMPPEGWRAAAQLARLHGRLQLTAALQGPATRRRLAWLGRARSAPRCHRCGSEARQRVPCAACGLAACAYCEACLALGRSRACALLLRSAAQGAVPVRGEAPRGTALAPTGGELARWGLSAAQSAAAAAALAFLARPPAGDGPGRFLLWAVTGAGKTEMIFPLLQHTLDHGGKALVATPRRDVVLELAPRLAKAFPDTSLATLYGGSMERWKDAQLTLATTHQLMRFYHGFDLVIIDELDAYPYHNDPMLAHAAAASCKPDGHFVYLSATPPARLQREAALGKLAHAKVPVRFHRHPLPVPKLMRMITVAQCLKRKQLPASIVSSIRSSLERDAQVFVFVTRIAQIEAFVQLMRRTFANIPIEGTSSQDAERASKVIAFRERSIRLLVTTTILERGVTIPRSDVFILDADNGLFDEASLVQMAGRAGRSLDDPAGRVVFAASRRTRSQVKAVSQIRKMNAIARRKGYLHPPVSK